jgi:hypothetical protein
VRSKIYWDFSLGIIYKANEGHHIRMPNIISFYPWFMREDYTTGSWEILIFIKVLEQLFVLDVLTQQVSLVEQVLLTFPSTWVHPRFLVGFVLLDLYFSVWCFCCSFSFGHSAARPSSIYGFWLPLQTLLIILVHQRRFNHWQVHDRRVYHLFMRKILLSNSCLVHEKDSTE